MAYIISHVNNAIIPLHQARVLTGPVSFTLSDVILQTRPGPCRVISTASHTYALATIPSEGTPPTPRRLNALGTDLETGAGLWTFVGLFL